MTIKINHGHLSRRTFYGEGELEITVDVDKLIRLFGAKAVRSKRNMATIASGAVVIRYIPKGTK